MADRVLIPLPDGRWLALTSEQFAAALTEGAKAIAAPVTSQAATAPESLLNASEMASVLNLPKSCVYEKARAGDIPSIRLGKHVRFRRSEVLKAVGLTDQQAVGRG